MSNNTADAGREDNKARSLDKQRDPVHVTTTASATASRASADSSPTVSGGTTRTLVFPYVSPSQNRLPVASQEQHQRHNSTPVTSFSLTNAMNAIKRSLTPVAPTVVIPPSTTLNRPPLPTLAPISTIPTSASTVVHSTSQAMTHSCSTDSISGSASGSGESGDGSSCSSTKRAHPGSPTQIRSAASSPTIGSAEGTSCGNRSSVSDRENAHAPSSTSTTFSAPPPRTSTSFEIWRRPNLQFTNKLPATKKKEDTAPFRLSAAQLAALHPTLTPDIIAKKRSRFEALLAEPIVNMTALRKISWSGIFSDLRPVVWKLLLGYLPANKERREEKLRNKRTEYHDAARALYYHTDRSNAEEMILRQIRMDLPRTCPSTEIFRNPIVEHLLERVLYIWALRHSASGYVQGHNDLIIAIFLIILSEHTKIANFDKIEDVVVTHLTEENWSDVEADCYWCFSKLLDGIQANYIFAQPGIQKSVQEMEELTTKLDGPLARHFQDERVLYIQFSFRWFNCLLLREFPLSLVLRMWDSYMSEENCQGFAVLHTYMCTALLLSWSEQLMEKEFQDVMTFLQHMPTDNWTEASIEELLSAAYTIQVMYHDAPSHLH
ncbi:gtpase activating protein [Pelomyxa schiedti]|nr:gtpase activating protein [Pelomyxa schiedti]